MPEHRRAAPGLTRVHRELLTGWLGDWTLVHDHSWPIQDTTVLHIRSSGGTRCSSDVGTSIHDHIVKASETSHHIGREIAAHHDVLDGLPGLPAPRLEFADVTAGILVTDYLPGRLLLGTPAQDDPDAFEQAGAILAKLQVPGVVSPEYMADVAARTAELIHRADGLVDERSLHQLADILAAVPLHPVRLHFTHGDYQPRNWLVHDGRVAVIDFGRGGQRSWVSDLVRLRSKDFRDRSDLEHAFMSGMGREIDAVDRDVLLLETLREGLATVVWSHEIGDVDFEEHGRTMVHRVIDERL